MIYSWQQLFLRISLYHKRILSIILGTLIVVSNASMAYDYQEQSETPCDKRHKTQFFVVEINA